MRSVPPAVPQSDAGAIVQVGQVQYDVQVGHLDRKAAMHKTIRLDPTTGRDPLRELDDVVRGLLDEGRHITVTVADDDEALSPQQAAERLRLSRQHVRRLIDAGELEAEQMPNSRYWKVSLSSILAFEERRGAARARADRHARELDRLGVPFE